MTDTVLPLCIDLDGTLILQDTTWLATRLLLKINPLYAVRFVSWMCRGRAYYKQQLAQRISLEPAQLMYRPSLLRYLKDEHKKGRQIYLVTATDERFARPVAEYVGLFTDVFASNGKINLRAEAKGQALVTRFGEKAFVYAGNSMDDLKVWAHSAEAIVCSQNKRLLAAVKEMGLPKRVML
jgi:phosphoserine phosphatase